MGFWGKVAKIIGVTVVVSSSLVIIGSSVMLGVGTNQTYTFNDGSFPFSYHNINQKMMLNNQTTNNQVALKQNVNWLNDSNADGYIWLTVNNEPGFVTDYNIYSLKVNDNTGKNAELKIKNTDQSVKLNFSSLSNSAFSNITSMDWTVEWKLNANCNKNFWQVDKKNASSSNQDVGEEFSTLPNIDLKTQKTIEPLILDYYAVDNNNNQISNTLNTLTININNNVQNSSQPVVDISFSNSQVSNDIYEVVNHTIDITPIISEQNISDPSKLSYQWYRNNQPLNGQTQKNLKINNVDQTWDGDQIYLEVTYDNKIFKSLTINISAANPSNKTQKIKLGIGSINFGKIWIDGKYDENATKQLQNKLSYNDFVSKVKNLNSQQNDFRKMVIQANDLMIAGAVLVAISGLGLIFGVILIILNRVFLVHANNASY